MSNNYPCLTNPWWYEVTQWAASIYNYWLAENIYAVSMFIFSTCFFIYIWKCRNIAELCSGAHKWPTKEMEVSDVAHLWSICTQAHVKKQCIFLTPLVWAGAYIVHLDERNVYLMCKTCTWTLEKEYAAGICSTTNSLVFVISFNSSLTLRLSSTCED